MGERLQALMVGTDPAGKGGVATVVSVLAREGFLARHRVRYIATHVGGTPAAKAAAMLGALAQVTLALQRGRPLLHVHSASRASFYRKSLLLAMARARGCRTIFHLHGAEFQQFASREAGPALRWWIRHTLEASDVVIALSDSWRDYLQRYAPRATVQVVPNSVPLGQPSPPARVQAGRILFLGRADARKGIYDLLQAMALLAPDFPAVRLAVGGDGDLAAVRAAAVQAGVEGRVELLGWLGAEQKAEQLAAAAVFVLPSYDEGLPMAMLEAMAAQKAVVVTPVGGIPETVDDDVNGLLVAPGDPAALAAALARLLREPETAARLAAAARATIAARYSTAVVLERLSAIYAGLGVDEAAPAPAAVSDA